MKQEELKIKESYYFVNRVDINNIYIEYGEVSSVLPALQYSDAYNSQYKRKENILFTIETYKKTVSKVVVNDYSVIFDSIDAIVEYAKKNDAVPMWGYSAIKHLLSKERN